VSADLSVIGLVGEPGREVQDFSKTILGAAGLARSVVVVSTSDEPALICRQAAYLTLAIAEYFRDLGKDVLVMTDSVTRFAMAQREIGLSAGEPPTAKVTRRPFSWSCRGCWSGPDLAPSRVPSPAFSACWLTATITTSRLTR
jgi:flagellar biosynthesis/type III secretory pathway ATPase